MVRRADGLRAGRAARGGLGRAAAAAGPLPNLPALGGLEVLDFAPTAAEAEEEDEEPPAPPDLRRWRPTRSWTLGHMGYEPAAAIRALAAAGGDFSKAVRALERECRRASRADPVLDAATGGARVGGRAAVARRRAVRDVCGAGNCKRRAGAAAGAAPPRVASGRVARAQGATRRGATLAATADDAKRRP